MTDPKPLQTIRKPALELPADYAPFSRTPTFDAHNLPPGLRGSHRTAHDVWAEIMVERGRLRYEWLDGSDRQWTLEAGEVGVIPAELEHRVEPLNDDLCFHLQLYRAPQEAQEDIADDDASPWETLDLRPLPPPVRHAKVFAAFDALFPGQALLLINDHDPSPLRGQFSVLRRHRYLWLPQSVGGERWSMYLYRREDREAPSLGEILKVDHQRLDQLLEAAAARLDRGDSLQPWLEDLAWGLKRHIHLEESLLFPAFIAAGGPEPPTEVMAMEHRQIEEALERARAAPEKAGEALAALSRLLEQHNFKEEGVLYPMMDRLLDARQAELSEALLSA